jgi:hypothetical protein
MPPMTTTRTLAAAIASGLALTPAHATAPRVIRAPVPHVQPHSQPAEPGPPVPGRRAPPAAASQPASAPWLPLEQRAYRQAHTGPYDALIADAALEHRLDAHLLRALLWEESKLQPGAINPVSGAVGLGQHVRRGIRGVNEIRCLKRARRLRCQLGDAEYTREKALQPEESIQATAEHLAALVGRWGVFGGVSFYNGGAHRRAFAYRVLRQANRYRVESGLPPLPGPRAPRRRPPVGLTS